MIGPEIFVQAVMDRLRPGWRERAAARRSPLQGLLVIVGFFSGLVLWYFSFRLIWEIHLLTYPEHRGHLRDFWPEGLGLRAFASSFLMVMPLGLASLGLGMVAANLLFHAFPPTREILDRHVQAHPELGYRRTMKELVRWVAITCLVGLALSLLGALTLSHLS